MLSPLDTKLIAVRFYRALFLGRDLSAYLVQTVVRIINGLLQLNCKLSLPPALPRRGGTQTRHRRHLIFSVNVNGEISGQDGLLPVPYSTVLQTFPVPPPFY